MSPLRHRGRRALDRLRARVAPTSTEGLDGITGWYLRAAERAGVESTVATALRTRSGLLVSVTRLLAERTGEEHWRAGYAELLLAGADPDARRVGVGVVAELVDAGHGDDLTARQARLYAHALLDEGTRGAARLAHDLPRLPLPTNEAIEVDADRAALAGDVETWWWRFSDRWRGAGLLVPRLLPDAEVADQLESAVAFDGEVPSLDRLTVDEEELAERRESVIGRAAAATDHGVLVDDLPLVSVVVTTYRPGPWLATAIRSLRDQTWPNLEIVIVDDRSGPAFAETLAGAAAIDPRARVVTRHRNGGAFRARSDGLEEAKGDYFTFLDADDWAHPEWVERLLLPLLADPALPATGTRSVRAGEDLRLTGTGRPAARHDDIGLMLPWQTLVRVGSFDDVRKGGDDEYRERIAAVTGREPLVVGPPLHIRRLRPGSLMDGDSAVGWVAGPVAGYREAYRTWHRHLAGLRERRELPRQPDGLAEYPGGPPPDRVLDWTTRTADYPWRTLEPMRPFVAPHSWRTTRAHAPFDVLVVDDLTLAEDPEVDLYGAVERLRDLDLRVALLHREDVSRLRAQPAPPHPDVTMLLDLAEDVVRVHPEEHVEARLLWVRRPSALGVDRPAPDVVAGAVVVDEPPAGTPAVDVAAVAEELRGWGVGPPQWLPRTAAEARVQELARGG